MYVVELYLIAAPCSHFVSMSVCQAEERANLTGPIHLNLLYVCLYVCVYMFIVLIGPAFNLFLAKSNFKVGPFWVTRLTVPGVSLS